MLGGRAPTVDDLPNLRYTGHVVTESMRLYPPAWGMARIAIEDTEIAGYPIPKGCGVSLAQWVVHRDPRWFERSARVPARAMGRRPAQANTALRVFSVWRRAEAVHRQQLRGDGGDAVARDAGAAISNFSDAGKRNHSGGFDHAAAEDGHLGKD